MPTLNRFPLLGLWAEEAARRAGYRRDEAESLGHAYAVLYAIRANRVRKPTEEKEKPAKPARKKVQHLHFGGDDLEVTYDAEGHVRGRVGGDRPQTPRTYRTSVRGKFPPGYYEKLQQAFHDVMKSIAPSRLQGKVVYDLYDTWKKECGVGKLVDLEELMRWCERHKALRGLVAKR